MALRTNTKLLLWELGCVFWVCFAGSTLHFAYELSDFWAPMAVIAAVNESIWEHLKIYFWPGLLYALIQYTYTRHIANNYWLGKLVALAVTPVVIIFTFRAYMAWVIGGGHKTSVGIILLVMFIGVLIGQLCSYRILSSPPVTWGARRYIAGGYASLVFMFTAFTFFPPKLQLFENYLCYEYTGEYGILADYEPYRIFRKPEEQAKGGGNSIWYCANKA